MLYLKFGDSQPLFLEILFLPSPLGLPVCVCVGVWWCHRFRGLCPFSFVSVLAVLGRTLCCVHLVSVASWLKVDGFFCLRKSLLSPSGGFSYWLLSFSTSEFLLIISHSFLIFCIWWELILKLCFSFLGIVSFPFASWTYWKSLSTKSLWASLGTVSLRLLFPWMGHSSLCPCKTHTFVFVENGFHEHYNVIPLETRVSPFPRVIPHALHGRHLYLSFADFLSENSVCVVCHLWPLKSPASWPSCQLMIKQDFLKCLEANDFPVFEEEGCVSVCVCVHIFHMQPSSAQLCLTHPSCTGPHGQPQVGTGCFLDLSWACARPQLSARLNPQDHSRAASAPTISHFPASSPKAFGLWTVCSKCHLWPRQQQRTCWPVSVLDKGYHPGSRCLR